MPATVVETHALSLCQFKTLTVEEYRLALRNLEQHYQDFLRDSQDSQAFGAEDRMQVESRYNKANQHYNTLVSTAEQGVCVSSHFLTSGLHFFFSNSSFIDYFNTISS